MPPTIDLIGKKFGRLKVIKRNGYLYKYHIAWLCMCDCGKTKTVSSGNLVNGKVKSCGCLYRETIMAGRALKHGLSHHDLYGVWASMLSRCGIYKGSPEDVLKYYKNRGIKVCKEWLEFKNFYKWAKIRWQKGLTIDREDNNGNYGPENCRFVTNKINQQNTRRSKRWYIKGVKYNFLRDASKKLGISYEKVRQMCCGYISSKGYMHEPKKDCYAINLY